VIYGKVTSGSGTPEGGVWVDVSSTRAHGRTVNEVTYTSMNGTYRIARTLQTGHYTVKMVDSRKRLSASTSLTIQKLHAYRVSGRIGSVGGFHFYLPIFSY
jgi:hypothetical protein